MAWEYLDEGDELEDHEYPDEPDEDLPDNEDDLYFRCPECGADVYEDAPQCPECGWYVTTATRTALSVGWKMVAVVVLIAFALGALALLR